MNKQYFCVVFALGIMNQHYACSDTNNMSMHQKEEFDIPLTEDLMSEHGILNRILLIYEEIIKRIDNNSDFSPTILNNAASIIKSFIEDYHEHLEEKYIFSLFEKHKKQTKLVKTLKKQHDKGRKITTQLQKLSASTQIDRTTKKLIKNLLQKFIRMYRPHAAREDTVLFPEVRLLISKEEFKELSEKFEDLEHELFGENGFENIIKKVEALEKELDIYNLEQFTPHHET